MADNLSREKRRKVMASIRAKNTRPELMLRKMLWEKGFRYRTHDKTVFGTPDISNKKHKIAIFVDGCFWHGCKTCYKEPRTNVRYWRKKIVKNKLRRSVVTEQLSNGEWKVFEFWEHQIIQDPQEVAREIGKFL